MMPALQFPRHPRTASGEVREVYFVGIGGTGMCGLAEILLTMDYRVRGSDLAESSAVERLKKRGAEIRMGHGSDIGSPDLVVVSAAVRPDNPEWRCARDLGIPVISRAELLASLMRVRKGIAIGGTHGKTSTTAMTAHLLHSAAMDPTYVIGGRVLSTSVNGALGEGEHLVAEADESDYSIMELQPSVALITNIDDDHLDAFDGSMDALEEAFTRFARNVTVFGRVIFCAEDPRLRRMASALDRRVLTYGFGPDCNYRATDLRREDGRTHFDLWLPNEDGAVPVHMGVGGEHNVLNALGAVAVVHGEGATVEALQGGLASFEGVARRLEELGEVRLEGKRVRVISDYGHHPTELEVTVRALRTMYPGRGLTMVFQPHRYTRTRALFGNFVRCLQEVDRLLLLPIYAASEAPLPGIDAQSLARAVIEQGHQQVQATDKDHWLQELGQVVRDGDLVLFQGAGDIGSMAARISGRDHA